MKKTAVVMMMVVAAALSGCATASRENPVPDIRDTDPMIVQLSDTARKAFESGETATAVAMYQRALDRARAMDNSREIGRNAYNLASCLIQLEDWDDAFKLLAEAERETLRAGDDAGPVLLLGAETARRRGDVKQAEALLNRLESRAVTDLVAGQSYVMRAHLACDRGDASRAEGHLNRARGYLRKAEDAGLAGSIAEVSGRIAVMNEKWADAAAAFDREAAWMQRSERLPEMADALERAGQNYQKAGKIDAAADRFFRSSRSWMAQGNYLDALRVIEQAVAMTPEDGGDAETMAVIAELFEDIRKSVEEKSQAGRTP